jgi:hypothetical protein
MTGHLLHNNAGNYRFLAADPGRPYSGGVVADAGHDLVHARFSSLVPLHAGIIRAIRHVTGAGRPVLAIAGFELRIPEPFTRAEFGEFNRGYIEFLGKAGLELDGRMPAARTNVAPTVDPPREPSVYAFTYSAPSDGAPKRFLVSGAAEASPGEPPGMLDSIVGQLTTALEELGASWDGATSIQLYGMQIGPDLVVDRILGHAGKAAVHGVTWFPSRPPIDDLHLEVDVRSSGSELVLTP